MMCTMAVLLIGNQRLAYLGAAFVLRTSLGPLYCACCGHYVHVFAVALRGMPHQSDPNQTGTVHSIQEGNENVLARALDKSRAHVKLGTAVHQIQLVSNCNPDDGCAPEENKGKPSYEVRSDRCVGPRVMRSRHFGCVIM
jgi:hypothetical protein